MAELVSRRFSSFFFSTPSPFLASLVRLHRAFHVFFCSFSGEIYSIRRFKLILILYRDGARWWNCRCVSHLGWGSSQRWGTVKLSDGRWHPQFFHAYIFPLYRGDTPLIGDRSENMVSRKFMGGKKNENKYGVELKFKKVNLLIISKWLFRAKSYLLRLVRKNFPLQSL